jgi:dTDP-4-dehydrorhamnose reductase
MTGGDRTSRPPSPTDGPLLVTGASGYVGRAVRAAATDAGWVVVGTSRLGSVDRGEWRALDVTDRAAVLALVAAVRPAAVINLAAVLGNRGGAEADNWRVNALGAGHVAAAAAAAGVRLVHVSSDVVHGGRPDPYTEADDPSPVHPYGAAKAAGEAAVAAAHPAAAIVRTSLVVSGGTWPPSRHEETVLALATGVAEGVLFTDEVRCPVPVDGLAEVLVALAGHRYAGVLNVAGGEALSRYELGVRIARRHGIDPADVPGGVRAGSGPVRPGVVRLDCSLARDLIGDYRDRI